MPGTPFDKATSSIPVTIVTHGPLPDRDDETSLVRLAPALHDHAAGTECVACAAAGDLRALLFDVLTESRQQGRALHAVMIDATAIADAQPVIDRLDPHSSAVGLRDHTVLRSFHLSRVI